MSFEQNPEDISINHEGKSAYTDLLDLMKINGALETFELIPTDGSERYFLVDLTTGAFYINGVEILCHYDEYRSGVCKDYKLIYFRRRREHVKLNVETKEVEPLMGEMFFEIGWECVLPNGENLKRTITVA